MNLVDSCCLFLTGIDGIDQDVHPPSLPLGLRSSENSLQVHAEVKSAKETSEAFGKSGTHWDTISIFTMALYGFIVPRHCNLRQLPQDMLAAMSSWN